MPRLYRIAKQKHAVYDGRGAFIVGGRWSSPGRVVIYATEYFATALLEIMVHVNRAALPGPHHAVSIDIPDDVAVEHLDPKRVRGWEMVGSPVARAFGDRWLSDQRTAVLYVPSVPGRPVEWNALINPAHPSARRLEPSTPFPVTWDGRLLAALPYRPVTGDIPVLPKKSERRNR